MDMAAITARLSVFGYQIVDETLLQYVADSEEREILRECKQETIPADFMDEAVDMVCGQYLMIQKNSGKDIGIDIDSAVSSISEGDVSVSFSIGKAMLSPEQRFDGFIEYLMRGKERLFEYRRLKW